MATELQRRASATQSTMDAYRGKRFKPGNYDCGQMVGQHLITMGQPFPRWLELKPYTTVSAGVKQLKALGFDSLLEVMDAQFTRIPPAAARVGDVIAVPGLEGPGTLAVALGNGRVLCWQEQVPMAIVGQPVQYVAAWRVPMAGGA